MRVERFLTIAMLVVLCSACSASQGSSVDGETITPAAQAQSGAPSTQSTVVMSTEDTSRTPLTARPTTTVSSATSAVPTESTATMDVAASSVAPASENELVIGQDRFELSGVSCKFVGADSEIVDIGGQARGQSFDATFDYEVDRRPVADGEPRRINFTVYREDKSLPADRVYYSAVSAPVLSPPPGPLYGPTVRVLGRGTTEYFEALGRYSQAMNAAFGPARMNELNSGAGATPEEEQLAFRLAEEILFTTPFQMVVACP